MSSGIHHIIGDVNTVPSETEGQNQAGGSNAGNAPPAPGLTNGVNGVNGLNGAACGPDGTPFKLGNFSIDDYRPLKVVVIGAGFSGITAGIRSVLLVCWMYFMFNFLTNF